MNTENIINKDYAKMTFEELKYANEYWTNKCDTACGWSSAYFSAKQVENTCIFAELKGWKLPNEFAIKRE